MKNYFIIQDKKKTTLPLIGVVSFSTGDGLETTQRYGYDASKTPQSLVFRRRNTALTSTLQLAFNPIMCDKEGVMMMDYISSLESLCGKKVELMICGNSQGSFVVQAVQFSAACDVVQIFPQMAVSIAMTEGYVKRETLETAVRAL